LLFDNYSNFFSVLDDKQEIINYLTQKGKQDIMLIFLRQFGCTFCREMLQEVSENIAVINQKGLEPVFVHMSSDSFAKEMANVYRLQNCRFISDPEQIMYDAFNLKKVSTFHFLHPKNIYRLLHSAVVKGNLWGRVQGDGFQLPGIFIIKKNRIVSAFRHKLVSDKPDILNLAAAS
jgi:peroxiredoxin